VGDPVRLELERVPRLWGLLQVVPPDQGQEWGGGRERQFPPFFLFFRRKQRSGGQKKEMYIGVQMWTDTLGGVAARIEVSSKE
jgi:hypothetical protein